VYLVCSTNVVLDSNLLAFVLEGASRGLRGGCQRLWLRHPLLGGYQFLVAYEVFPPLMGRGRLLASPKVLIP